MPFWEQVWRGERLSEPVTGCLRKISGIEIDPCAKSINKVARISFDSRNDRRLSSSVAFPPEPRIARLVRTGLVAGWRFGRPVGL
jgi:hypothetical protein